MKPETVTASEIASWVYCPEAWRLNATGAPSANQPARDAGTSHHEEKSTADRAAGDSVASGWLLVILAALILLLWLWTAYR